MPYYLFDSNVIIDSLAGKMPSTALQAIRVIVDDDFYVSIISKIEVLGYASGDIDTDDRSQQFISTSHILELSQAIADQTIAIRKKTRIKLPDAIIAATALIHDLTLLTHNVSDFNKIPGLHVLDPHSL